MYLRSIIPLPKVLATAVPKVKAAMKLKNAAQTTAMRGERTRVETTVAMELAASWKSLRKSKVRATRMSRTANKNILLALRTQGEFRWAPRVKRDLPARPISGRFGEDLLDLEKNLQAAFKTTACMTSDTSSHLSVVASSTS